MAAIDPQAVKMNDAFQHDEAQFRAKIPYALKPTSLKGVYVHEGPPDSFDPKTASQDDLMRYGILVRKPGPGDPPEFQKLWDQFFSRKWLAKDRITPEFEVHVGKTHILKKQPTKDANGNDLTNAWAGCGGRTGKWSACLGTWTIPTVSKPTEPQGNEGGWNSSSWVGIDGYFISNDVVQAGIEQRVNAAGVASYSAWYEWYAPPQAGSPPYVWEVGIPNMPVAPGQSMTCYVSYVSTTAASISLTNNTTGVHFSITLAPPPGANFNGSTYEWIMEAPDGGYPTSALPKFTPVVFTGAVACGPNSASANPATTNTTNTINIENTSGKVLTSVTNIGTDTCTINFIG